MYRDLFDAIGPAPSPANAWVPDAPRSLDGITDIELDCETTGLRWWAGDRPVGIGICLPDGSTQYLPWGHRGGGNLDEETVKRWAQRELRGKRITNANTRFDVHMLREWGVDLEAQGCTVSDVQHYAALLDDHRYRFNQEALVKDFLPDSGEAKVTSVHGAVIDPKRMAEYHAGVVAVRACADVRQVQMLKRVMWKQLDAQDLQRVRQLEDDVIFVVCEMEKNGAKIDIEKLDVWLKEAERALQTCYMDIFKATGLRMNTKSPEDMKKLFEHLKIPISHTAKGSASFTGLILESIDHPIVKTALRANKLTDLLVKYLRPYARSVDRKTGILRYALHQLRSVKDKYDDNAVGTVSGRFSSSKIYEGPTRDLDEGLNVQQVMTPSKQEAKYGPDWIVRELHIPEDGTQFLSADAMQIEYRIFASRTGSKRLLKVYEDDPLASFHKMMHEMLKPFKPDLTYRRQKDLNFAKVYGAGLRKMAAMMEFVTAEQLRKLYDDANWKNNPLLKDTLEIEAIYNREIPEASKLLKRAKQLAETRGYVHTKLGRRSRFPNGERSHKALNAVIQGDAADTMKMKLVELHREREVTAFLLRYPVHDEVDGDARDGEETARRVTGILNTQTVAWPVPILWEVNIGANWKECH